MRNGSLKVILQEAESPLLPVHLLTPYGRLSVPKVRAFVDFAELHLKAYFAGVADGAIYTPAIQPQTES